MSEQLQYDVVDDGEPPPSGYELFIETVVSQADTVSSRYTSYVVGRHETRVTVTDDTIIAQIGMSGCRAYARLSIEERQRLEDDIVDEMTWLAGKETPRDARAMCNNAPVIFEPIGHEMLLGERDPVDNRWLRLEAHDIPTFDQKQLLMGGLAVLLWQLERESQGL